MSHNLSAAQIEELRSMMVARSGQLREEIRQTLVKSDNEQYAMIADEVGDLEDDAFADLMVDVNLAEIDRDLQELRLIENAIERMREGGYGRCDDCGSPIELQRLRATPFAMRCFDCQSAFERTHYQQIGHTL